MELRLQIYDEVLHASLKSSELDRCPTALLCTSKFVNAEAGPHMSATLRQQFVLVMKVQQRFLQALLDALDDKDTPFCLQYEQTLPTEFEFKGYARGDWGKLARELRNANMLWRLIGEISKGKWGRSESEKMRAKRLCATVDGGGAGVWFGMKSPAMECHTPSTE